MKNIVLLLSALLCLGGLQALQTANSLPVSGSFLLRAQGTEALYWNPASINADYQDIIIPGLNATMGLTNNAFDLDTYNYVSGRYLTEADKAMLLGKIDRSLRINNDMHILLAGMTFGNIALSTSSNGYAKMHLSKDYIKIVLEGNEEVDYQFNKSDNQVSGIAYQDITLGGGGWNITQYFPSLPIPVITAGASVSALLGGAVAQTQSFQGSLHSGYDGMILKQDIYLKTGIGGWGAKALISLKSSPMKNLEVGASFDNLGGFIRWVGKNDVHHFKIESDSIFASNLGEDFTTQEDTSYTVGDFTTRMPVEMHLAALYQYRNANISLDYVQATRSSELTGAIGNISWGVEYSPLPYLPIQAGMRFGNSEVPWSTSYGIAVRGKSITWGIGMQIYKSMLPGDHATGMSFSNSLSIHY